MRSLPAHVAAGATWLAVVCLTATMAAQAPADSSPASPTATASGATQPARKARKAKAKAHPQPPAPVNDVVPPDQIHPITSLPKPPAAAQPAAAAPPTETTPPVPAAAPDASASKPEPVAPPVAPPAAAAAPSEPAPVDVGPPAVHAAVFPPVDSQRVQPLPMHIRPFSAIGIAFTVGSGGAGFDVAVPLAQHFNVRAGASFLQYSGSFDVDGITINGAAKLRDARLAVDVYPFKGTQFRVSPGVTLYNGNNLNATAIVPGGQTFTLNDVTYTSDATDPVNGGASLTFGYRTAPSMTIGWGNLVPRKRGHHLSIPFEIGAQYINNPKVALYLQGTACSTENGFYGCGQLQTDPTAQSNLHQQEQKINNDLHSYLRFYPILSIGVGWSFSLRHDHPAER